MEDKDSSSSSEKDDCDDDDDNDLILDELDLCPKLADPEQTDTDGDGAVTREEAQAAAFNRVDENSDGYLTEEEFRKAKRSGRGRHGPGNSGEWGEPHGDS